MAVTRKRGLDGGREKDTQSDQTSSRRKKQPAITSDIK
jgi:hypothetical protein